MIDDGNMYMREAVRG